MHLITYQNELIDVKIDLFLCKFVQKSKGFVGANTNNWGETALIYM